MSHYRLDVYVPESHLEELKSALFAAGAGHLGEYDCCCFQMPGTGQFRPSDRANPFLGEAGRLEKVAEWKLEMIVSGKKLPAVLQALKTAHPYETPAFQYWKVGIE
jgi:hypothetical protein